MRPAYGFFILKNVNVTIPDRTTTAIIGPSGSGKTTLCSLIARFWDVDRGSICIGGTDIREYTLATANVDPENEDKLQKAMEELMRDKTILMIAHRLKTVQKADRILVLDEGRIVQNGTHAEPKDTPGIYRDFLGVRKEAAGWKL